jgi:hypothetical protein
MSNSAKEKYWGGFLFIHVTFIIWGDICWHKKSQQQSIFSALSVLYQFWIWFSLHVPYTENRKAKGLSTRNRFRARIAYKELMVSIILRTPITTACHHISRTISWKLNGKRPCARNHTRNRTGIRTQNRTCRRPLNCALTGLHLWHCSDSGDSDILCTKRKQSGKDSVIEGQPLLLFM